MHIFKICSFVFAIAACSGCVSTETKTKLDYHRDKRGIAPIPITPVINGSNATIEKTYEFKADTSVFDKNIPFTLQQGVYVHSFSNVEGDFYRGTKGCVTGGGFNGIGQVEGGFFIPKDVARRVMLWRTNRGGSMMIMAGTAPIMIGIGPDPKTVLWVIAVPPGFCKTSQLFRRMNRPT